MMYRGNFIVISLCPESDAIVLEEYVSHTWMRTAWNTLAGVGKVKCFIWILKKLVDKFFSIHRGVFSDVVEDLL